MERKIRSKNGLVGYINGLINNEIKDLCENYEDSELTLCKSYKEILEEKSASIILLWEEILDDIDDDDKHMEEFQKSMDFQLKVKHQIKILESFIDKAPSMSVGNANQNHAQPIHNVPIASPNVQLPKMESKKFNSDSTNWCKFIECFEAQLIKTPRYLILKK